MQSNLSDFDLAVKKHAYRILGGEVVPSVTQIIHLLDDDGKSAKMAGAAAKIAAAGGNYRREWTDKMHRGTRIHAHCEKWLRDEDVEPEDDETPYLDALASFFKIEDPFPIEIERVVLSSRHSFGGRFDFIARLGEQTTLVDVKTGSPYPVEHALQLAAYRHADGMAVYEVDGSLARVDPLPPIDRAGCLYLKPTGEYDFVIYDTGNIVYALFLDLLAVHKKLPVVKELLSI